MRDLTQLGAGRSAAPRHGVSLIAAGWLALLVNTAYIAALPSPSLFYMGNVVLRLALGLALTVAALRLRRDGAAAGTAGVYLLVVAAATGIALAVAGNTTPHRWLLWTHIGVSALAVIARLVHLQHQAAARGGGWPGLRCARFAGGGRVPRLPLATSPQPRAR